MPDSATETARTYRVGHLYRDRASKTREDDEFLHWLSSEGETIPNSSGIRFKDFRGKSLTDPESNKGVPAYFILLTSGVHTQSHNPWDDIIDHRAGEIYYWGDAKHASRTKHYDDFPGNARVIAANNLRLAGRHGDLPPFLHFTRVRSGWIRFNGLCSLTDVRLTWFEDKGQPVKNLRLALAIPDCEEVPLNWLADRPLATGQKAHDRSAPEAWRDACRGRIRRRQIWTSKILSKEDQLPEPESDDAEIMEEVRRLSPQEFERFVVGLIDKLPEIVPGLDHQVFRTRTTGDHGVDFFGSFTLPYPVSYEIGFVGEAKRYADAVTPDKVSRLVARLGRGQYGLFFTTSWFSKQTQKEVLADRYPVRLFSALDIVNILRAGNCISGTGLNPDWKASVLAQPASVDETGLVPSIT